ncbi:MAG TPA: hypothetical protein PLS44_03780, partial [Candidatus Cloacimonas sp.]|nr:hypothetical protein [Candidatus Cloacimonas sp.]
MKFSKNNLFFLFDFCLLVKLSFFSLNWNLHLHSPVTILFLFNLQPSRPQDPKPSRPQDPKTPSPQDPKTPRPQDLKTPRPQ